MHHHNADHLINPAIPSAEDEYANTLSAETQTFIKISERFASPNPEPTLTEMRTNYLAYCADVCPPEEFSILRENSSLVTPTHPIPLRRYTPESPRSDAQILFFHGGGFILGNLDSHDACCAQFAERSGMTLTAVDYRLAPEHPFPAAFKDCLAVYLHLQEPPSTPIILCGDSTGGTLAAGVSHHCRDQQLVMPCGQLLIYPYLGGDPSAGSYQRHQNAPLLSLQDMFEYGKYYYGNTLPLDDPCALPLRSWKFSGLPATVVAVAEIDPLADDGRLYTLHLKAAGVSAHCDIATGLPHGFLRAWNHIDAVRACWARMLKALDALAQQKSSTL